MADADLDPVFRSNTARESGVVVTGLGCVTPLGVDAAATWQGVVSSRSGVTRLPEDFDPRLPVRIAARTRRQLLERRREDADRHDARLEGADRHRLGA